MKGITVAASNLITPPEGVKSFFKNFGTNAEVQNAASALGLKLSAMAIASYIKNDHLPDYIYNALRHLVISEEIHVAQGFVEFYGEGKPIGKFYMARGISAVVKRERRA